MDWADTVNRTIRLPKDKVDIMRVPSKNINNDFGTYISVKRKIGTEMNVAIRLVINNALKKIKNRVAIFSINGINIRIPWEINPVVFIFDTPV